MSTTKQQTGNPFETAEVWGTSAERRLGEGNHRVKIAEADGSGTNQQGHPKIELRFENTDGSIRKFEHYSETFLRKVVELFDVAGVARPAPGEFDPADHCRIKQEVLDRLVGREVGIVVRPEKSFKDPTKEYPEVQGYISPEKVESAPAPSGDPLAGGQSAVQTGGAPAGARKAPF